MNKLLLVLLTTCSIVSHAQSLFVPSGTSGIGASANGNIGIGTSSPGAKLEVNGDISLPSFTGNKQIYTWSPIDANWRIGMSATPGFTTSMATSHVEYLTYSTNPGQGFAVGVNGGQSSFEITGSDHNAFFRGSVGIGTPSPQALLHVTGTSFLGTAGNEFYISSGGTVFGTKAGIRNNGGDVVFNSRNGGTLYLNRDVAADVKIQAFNSATSSHVDIATFLQNGNVGIGTTPSYPLHILSSSVDAGLRIAASGNSTQIALHVAGGDYGYLGLGGNTSLRGNGQTSIFEGAVGIGTTNPGSYKLAVEGKIGAREVNVIATNPWPDYVFEKNYKLTSLEEIKNYIDQNQHLPEVPSAKEVKENGVNLGEMNALLLKKIEELTLYVIELKKENESTKAQMETMQSEINRLKK